MNKISSSPFFISIFGGILVWLIVFLITPAYVVNKMDTETLAFLFFGYLFLIVGYLSVPIVNKSKAKKINTKLISYIILFVLLCYVVRFIDLFYYRGLRFSNAIYQNRMLAQNGSHNVILLVASVFKTLFFIPLLLLLLKNKRNKWLVIIAVLLFFLPLVEAVLRGSRSPFLRSFVYLIIVLLVTKSIQFSKKNILLFLTAIGVLFFISTQILMKREGPKNENPYVYLVQKAIYNDFLSPKKEIIKFMHSDASNTKKKLVLSALQIGQYYTHGVFEFDHVVKYYKQNKYQRQFGKFTFFVLPKFTNKYQISNVDLEKVTKSSPRGYTFISFFGGMYIDFGWFALLFMFLLGVIQKVIYNKIRQQKYYFAPLFVFLLFTNFFMLTFNFFRGTGTYTLISCIIFALLSSSYFKYLKSNL